MQRSITNTINFGVQILSAVLMTFAIAGLDIDPTSTAVEIIAAIKAKSLPIMLTLAFNLGTMVYIWVRTWNTDKPNFWAFLTSRSWLISVANIVVPALALVGVVLPIETATKLIDDGLTGNWNSFISTLIITIVGIIGTWLKPKLAIKASMDSDHSRRKAA